MSDSRAGLLLDDTSLRNPAANELWEGLEVDRLLDSYLEGAEPGRIAIQLRRNRKAIIRKIQEFIYNERNRVVDYRPVRRTSRKGRRFTPNELQVMQECLKRGVPPKKVALVLSRGVEEVSLPKDSAMPGHDIEVLRKAGVGVDLILAYRFLYYVKGISLVSDRDYDLLEKEEIEFGGGKGVLDVIVGSDVAEDYPPHIRSLALYLAFKYTERKQ